MDQDYGGTSLAGDGQPGLQGLMNLRGVVLVSHSPDVADRVHDDEDNLEGTEEPLEGVEVLRGLSKVARVDGDGIVIGYAEPLQPRPDFARVLLGCDDEHAALLRRPTDESLSTDDGSGEGIGPRRLA